MTCQREAKSSGDFHQYITMHDTYGRPIVRFSLYTYGLKCLNKHCYCDSRKEHTLRKHAYIRRCWLDYNKEKTAAARRRSTSPTPLRRPTILRRDSGYDGSPRGVTLTAFLVVYRTLPTPEQKTRTRTGSSRWLSTMKTRFRALKQSVCDSLYLYLIQWTCCIHTSLPSKNQILHRLQRIPGLPRQFALAHQRLRGRGLGRIPQNE